MVDSLAVGDLVEHPALGLGKVIYVDGSVARVYFKDKREPQPELRTSEFRLPSPYLIPCPDRQDPILDALPPWTDGRFVRYETTLDIDTAKARFMQQFRKGFDDPDYFRRERAYKESAHGRYASKFAPFASQWLKTRDVSAIVTALQAVYGDSAAPKGNADERLNLLYPRVEEPAYFEALEKGGDQLFRYVEGVVAFLERSTPETFDAFVAGLLGLPTRSGGASLEHWTTLTWLPFIARPDEHILVKPTITKTFASILPFEIRYRAELNYETYRLSAMMAKQLCNQLQHSELNLSGRRLDMIDVQSFMWVVMRYAQPGIESTLD